MTENPENKVGWKIVESIRQALVNDKLSFNQRGSLIQVDGAGRTFIEIPAIFEWYREQHTDGSQSEKALQNQFKRLKVTATLNGGKDVFRGKLLASEELKTGFVVDDESVLWEEGAPCGGFVIR